MSVTSEFKDYNDVPFFPFRVSGTVSRLSRETCHFSDVASRLSRDQSEKLDPLTNFFPGNSRAMSVPDALSSLTYQLLTVSFTSSCGNYGPGPGCSKPD